MESLTKIVPFMTKLIAVLIGGLISLVLAGDIKINEQNEPVIKHLKYILIKMACAVGIGWYSGSFVVDYFNFEHLTFMAQGLFYIGASTFGMLFVGILYRSAQLTFTNKTLSEIISEIKNILKALLK